MTKLDCLSAYNFGCFSVGCSVETGNKKKKNVKPHTGQVRLAYMAHKVLIMSLSVIDFLFSSSSSSYLCWAKKGQSLIVNRRSFDTRTKRNRLMLKNCFEEGRQQTDAQSK